LVASEDDQDFLIKHKEALEKESAQDKDKGKSGGGLLRSLQALGTVTTESVSKPTAPSATATTQHTATAPPPTQAPALPETKPPATNEHQVLADFFNSLIAKDRAGPTRKPSITSELTKGLNIPARGSGGSSSASRDDVAKQLEKIKKGISRDKNDE